MLEVTVVKGRLDFGVGRGQPDVTGTVGQAERTRDAGHPLRGDVPVEILGPETGDALLPLVDHGAGSEHHVVAGAGPLGGVVKTKVYRIGMSREGDAVFDLEGQLGTEMV